MNISISEIIVVLLVALLVIKPEQLPDVAFKLGKWSKRLRDTMTKLRQEVDGTVTKVTQEVLPVSLPEKIELNNNETHQS